MNSQVVIKPVMGFLKGETPSVWYKAASTNIPCLLIDHANCEKKAASAALGLMYKYIEHGDLLQKLSRLAREELRHFEQVLELMTARNVDYEFLSASDYAKRLREEVRTSEPGRLVDLLICGAIVEARSCERFFGLSKIMPIDVSSLYSKLLNSEARHFEDYLEMACNFSSLLEVQERASCFLDTEWALISSPDPKFRFHSGLPN
tara:strand:- start:135 stop:749 length:615 start_codon:yes stop_codon:yes gene_type:complete